ncbi:ATP-binding cassette domain-containing protein [Actinomycetota bacterium]|jgi:simple sugar transport system ATP-binding protein|nr:ATP-binding cassette domain-containing protein [Actinomycetota bacterium]MDE1046718.1 ATP-binding cassette domain-containing protein [Candidatus Nanopelagicales bacterium]
MALLEARGMVRTYGSVVALDGADFDIEAGQVTALIGDNGAGKSTMVKILSGTEQFEEGEVTLEGQKVVFNNPAAARSHGIETVFQDLALCPHLDPVENLYLNREIKRSGVLGLLGFMDRKAMRDRSVEVFTDLGATVRKLNEPVGTMSGGQKQSVAVARSAAWASKIIFFDEPTAALGVVQTANVLDLIRRVRDKGIGVVLISHSMPEVLEVADTIQVLRRGRRVATIKSADSSVEELVGVMTGKLDEEVA